MTDSIACTSIGITNAEPMCEYKTIGRCTTIINGAC